MKKIQNRRATNVFFNSVEITWRSRLRGFFVFGASLLRRGGGVPRAVWRFCVLRIAGVVGRRLRFERLGRLGVPRERRGPVLRRRRPFLPVGVSVVAAVVDGFFFARLDLRRGVGVAPVRLLFYRVRRLWIVEVFKFIKIVDASIIGRAIIDYFCSQFNVGLTAFLFTFPGMFCTFRRCHVLSAV